MTASGKFPFRIFGQRMGLVSIGVSVGVQYLGEGCVCPGLMSLVSRCWCQGVRDAKESCEVGCEMVSSFRLQDVASMECSQQGMSL